MKAQTPADGVVPFSPNARQWQDGATAEWLVALDAAVAREAHRAEANVERRTLAESYSWRATEEIVLAALGKLRETSDQHAHHATRHEASEPDGVRADNRKSFAYACSVALQSIRPVQLKRRIL